LRIKWWLILLTLGIANLSFAQHSSYVNTQGVGNEATITQVGSADPHAADIYQDGNTNKANIYQEGSGHWANSNDGTVGSLPYGIWQEGNKNIANIEQYGEGGRAEIVQRDGNNNEATISQDAISPVFGRIEMVGNRNYGYFIQNGQNISAEAQIFGNRNSVRLLQSIGVGLKAGFYIVGNNNILNAQQFGNDNDLGDRSDWGIQQLGNNNFANVLQNGDLNKIRLLQQGDNNSAEVYQTGTGHQATISQIGNGNAVIVNQSN